MNKKFCILLNLAVLVGFSQPTLAQSATIASPDAYISTSPCKPTPALSKGNGGYPGMAAIIPSNKLAEPAGKAVLARGQIVSLSGRVLDENCVPVPDAVVEIWHANTQGQYVIATNAQRANPYPTFAGSGRAVTDNLGRYNFVTIFPGPYDHRAPHIHFRVGHRHFPTLFTEIYFAGDRRTLSDPELKSMSPANRDRLMIQIEDRINTRSDQGIQGYFDIVLRGKNAYKKF